MSHTRRNRFLRKMCSPETKFTKIQRGDDFIQTFHRGVYFIDDNLILAKDLGIGQVIQSCKTASAQQLTIIGTVTVITLCDSQRVPKTRPKCGVTMLF